MEVELDNIVNDDARNVLNEIESESVHVTITSPPYNIGIEYGDGDDDTRTIGEWSALIEEVVEATYRVTVPDGKCCIVVGASFDSSPQDDRYRRISLRRRIIEAASSAGFDLMDEIIWYKHQFHSHGEGTLFGSYPYPTNLLINQLHEYVLVFRKPLSRPDAERPDIPPTGSERRERSKLRREDWREWTQSVWHIEAEQSGDLHRAAFPVELPRRLVRLYSFAGDVVMDPFAGTGTTAVAARMTGRKFLGIERDADLASQARTRVSGDGVVEVSENGGELESPETPEEIPDYIADGIDRQDPSTLRAIAAYASGLAQRRESVTLADVEETLNSGDSVVEVARNDDGTIVEKRIPCGEGCDGCPHGPYRYRVYRDDGELRTEYLGAVESDT